MNQFLIVGGLCCFLIAGCSQSAGHVDDPLLAQVYKHSLYLSQAENYLPKAATPEDSLSQLRNFVQQWVREELLLHEAEKFVPEDIDVDALVEDYRASLIISNYERTIVQMMVDTFISHEELVRYYERNKEQYKLEQPIVRCRFVKVVKDTTDIDAFKGWWESDDPVDVAKVAEYASSMAELSILEDSTWYRADEITALIPPGRVAVENMRPNSSFKFSDDEYEYFLLVTESLLSTEIAPLSYIREQAIRYIMHKRRLDLLEQTKAEVLQREMQSNQIKILVE